MLIGVTGTDGAGKGTAVEYLVKQHNFTHYSSRDLIVAEIERQGLPVNRNQMRLTANDLREQFGNDFVVKQALEKAKADNVKNAVIESVRALAEAEYLKEHEGILLAVDADQAIRYKRVQQRRSASDLVDFETFKSQEELEKNDPNPHGMQKAKVMAMADYTIKNSTSIEELHAQVDAVLHAISQQ